MFYEEIHKSQQKFEEQQAIEKASSNQKDEIRYIILLKENETEIHLEVEKAASDENQIHLIDPLTETKLENSEESGKTVTEEVSVQSEEEESGTGNLPSIDTTIMSINLDGFPKEIINDSKLTVKGKELSKLIARFYRLECNLCSMKRKFRKFSAMINHFKNVHSSKGFVTCCGIKISKIRQIALHMARHVQPEAFQCPSCKKLLTCPKILQYHIQNHLPENERNLACPEPGCSRRFSYQSALVTHSISHLPDEERTTFGCDKCGRKFSTNARLTAHYNTVHAKNILRKEFACGICSKKFLCKSNLSYHLTTHKNFEFQVQCEICKKWLKNKICLRKHMTVHSEVKHYCDLCEYSAANKQCLMNHRKVQHSDVKPFSCEVRLIHRSSSHHCKFPFLVLDLPKNLQTEEYFDQPR